MASKKSGYMSQHSGRLALQKTRPTKARVGKHRANKRGKRG